MPLLTDQARSTLEVASDTRHDFSPAGVTDTEPRPAAADALGRSEGGDPSNDLDDIAAWYPVFLTLLLLGLLGLGGLWVWNFAI